MPDHKRLEDYNDKYSATGVSIPESECQCNGSERAQESDAIEKERAAQISIPESECQCYGDCECWDIVISPDSDSPLPSVERFRASEESDAFQQRHRSACNSDTRLPESKQGQGEGVQPITNLRIPDEAA